MDPLFLPERYKYSNRARIANVERVVNGLDLQDNLKNCTYTVIVEGEVNDDHNMVWSCGSVPIDREFGIPVTQNMRIVSLMGTTWFSGFLRGNIANMNVNLVSYSYENSEQSDKVSILPFVLEGNVLKLYKGNVGTILSDPTSKGFLSFGDIAYLNVTNEPVIPPVGMRVRLAIECSKVSIFPVLNYEDSNLINGMQLYFPTPYYRANSDVEIKVTVDSVVGSPRIEVISYLQDHWADGEDHNLRSIVLTPGEMTVTVPNDHRFLSIQFVLPHVTTDAYIISSLKLNGIQQLEFDEVMQRNVKLSRPFPVLPFETFIDRNYLIYYPKPYYKPNTDIVISVAVDEMQGSPLLEVISSPTDAYSPDSIVRLRKPLALGLNKNIIVPNDGRFLSIQLTLQDQTVSYFNVSSLKINGTEQLTAPVIKPLPFPVLNYEDSNLINGTMQLYFPTPYYKPDNEVKIKLTVDSVVGSPRIEVISYLQDHWADGEDYNLRSIVLTPGEMNITVPNDSRYLSIQFVNPNVSTDSYAISSLKLNGTQQLNGVLVRPVPAPYPQQFPVLTFTNGNDLNKYETQFEYSGDLTIHMDVTNLTGGVKYKIIKVENMIETEISQVTLEQSTPDHTFTLDGTYIFRLILDPNFLPFSSYTLSSLILNGTEQLNGPLVQNPFPLLTFFNPSSNVLKFWSNETFYYLGDATVIMDYTNITGVVSYTFSRIDQGGNVELERVVLNGSSSTHTFNFTILGRYTFMLEGEEGSTYTINSIRINGRENLSAPLILA